MERDFEGSHGRFGRQNAGRDSRRAVQPRKQKAEQTGTVQLLHPGARQEQPGNVLRQSVTNLFSISKVNEVNNLEYNHHKPVTAAERRKGLPAKKDA